MTKTRKPGSGRKRSRGWDGWISKLGTIPDQRIADAIGLTAQGVSYIRRRMGIAAFGNTRK